MDNSVYVRNRLRQSVLSAGPVPKPARAGVTPAGRSEASYQRLFERHPQPIVRAAIRRLRRNPPGPPERISVVHGDYRSGNFMHDGHGKILGVLDWEMVHLGDAVEDLAWCFDPLWNHFDATRVAATIKGGRVTYP